MITRDTILATIQKHLLRIVDDLDESRIDFNQSMRELGATSLDVVEVVADTMRELRIKLDLSEFGEIKNINGLADFLYQSAQTQPKPGE
jgi:polyketide biosynthesis acyl carrier protein